MTLNRWLYKTADDIHLLLPFLQKSGEVYLPTNNIRFTLSEFHKKQLLEFASQTYISHPKIKTIYTEHTLTKFQHKFNTPISYLEFIQSTQHIYGISSFRLSPYYPFYQQDKSPFTAYFQVSNL